MRLINRYRCDGDFCPDCGEEIRWVKLDDKEWIAVDPVPVYYIPGEGKEWLVESLRWYSDILKDCLIWRKGRGMPTTGLKVGFKPHVFECIANPRNKGGKRHA